MSKIAVFPVVELEGEETLRWGEEGTEGIRSSLNAGEASLAFKQYDCLQIDNVMKRFNDMGNVVSEALYPHPGFSCDARDQRQTDPLYRHSMTTQRQAGR